MRVVKAAEGENGEELGKLVVRMRNCGKRRQSQIMRCRNVMEGLVGDGVLVGLG